MTGQDRPPAYSADRAANVVLGMAIVGAIVCLTAGVLQLRGGSDGTGWLLIAVGVLPLIGAVLVRVSLKRAKRNG